MVWNQILGVLSMIVGFFFMFGVPDVEKFQPKGFSRTGIVVGIFFIVLGIYLFRS
jgi:hypothetical protein